MNDPLPSAENSASSNNSPPSGDLDCSEYQLIPKLTPAQIENLKKFQSFEPPKTLEERQASRKSGKFFVPIKEEPKTDLPKTKKIEEKPAQKLLFKVRRISLRWKIFRGIVFAYYSFLLFAWFDTYIPYIHYLELFTLEERFFLHHPLWISVAVFVGLLLFLAILRPKYLEVDPAQEVFYYSGYFFGRWKFFFYNIARVEFEVDMTHALIELEYSELCRIYLRFIDKRLLLVTEGYGQKSMGEMAQNLADTLHVVAQSLHRVGIKQKSKISLGRYAVIEELSHGGMGKIFLARDESQDRLVALKILPASLALESVHHTKGFGREIDILQKLSHPNIVQIYDVGRETYKGTDVYFFAMEYIEGKNLTSLIPKNAKEEIDYKRIARLIFQCGVALEYIHENHIIHRDIKPSNIMIRPNDHGEEQAVLIDFGIAKDVTTIYKQIESGSNVIDRSHLKGSPAYMSPEQFLSNQSVDYRTDIYSLGVTLYQLLTSTLPVGKGGMTTQGKRVTNWEPKEPRMLNSKIPEDLEIITLRALEKEKSKRYQRAIDMAEDLQLWLHGQPIKSKVTWFQKWKRKWRRIRRFFLPF